jgi:formate-dependent nitrite reductase membrane component NrfD
VSEHFAGAPDWTWYILFYFFFAGLTGGCYVVASLLRLFGKPGDQPASRLAHVTSFVALLPCPVLLVVDLGRPVRFWHMLVNTTPGNVGASFKYWSPMSVGAWGLLAFGIFATGSFLAALGPRGLIGRILGSWFGGLWSFVGLLLGLFVAGYTGVLLSVSNQPVWSDTYALGGLFLASGLSASVALLVWLTRFQRLARYSMDFLVRGEQWFQILELALIALFVATLIQAGTLTAAVGLPWIMLWAFVVLSLIPGIGGFGRPHANASGNGTAAVSVPAVLPWVVLLGVLALRAAVIFSAQF